jgi:hypothetical protein
MKRSTWNRGKGSREKSLEKVELEAKIAHLMTLAASDPDVTVRQIARRDAALLRLQLGTK